MRRLSGGILLLLLLSSFGCGMTAETEKTEETKGKMAKWEDRLSFLPTDRFDESFRRGERDYVVLFKGNSITSHGVNEKTIRLHGWDHVAGMAASSAEKDYVHLFAAALQKKMPDRIVRVLIGKGGRPDLSLAGVEVEKQYRPDLIVVQNGEHSPDAETFRPMHDKLIAALGTFPGAPVILSIGIWNPRCREEFRECTGPNYFENAPKIEKAQKEIAEKYGIEFAPVSPYEMDPANTGYGKSAGCRWHPNDNGMKCYAAAALAAWERAMEKRAGVQ